MQKLILNSIVIIVCLVVLDFGFGYCHEIILQHLPVNKATKYHYFQTVKSDVLLIGASRERHGFVTDVFKQRLCLDAINIADDGHDILYSNALIDANLKRYIPKIIVLGVCDMTMDGTTHKYFSDVQEYYGIIPEVTDLYNTTNDVFAKLKFHSKIYTANKSLTRNIYAFISPQENIDQFEAFHNSNITDIKKDCTYKFIPERISENALLNIVELCKEKNVFLVIVNTPTLMDRGVDFSTYMRKLSNKYKFLYLDYESNIYYRTHTKLFYDEGHLNGNGANIFSREIADSIINYYNEDINIRN